MRAPRVSSRASTRAKASNGDLTTSGLSQATIVQAACEMIRESGTEGLTMRALSDRLGVALGATYHHVPNREALLLLVCRDLTSRVPLPDPNDPEWMVAMRDLITGFYDLFSQYRGIVSYLFGKRSEDQPDEVGEVVAQMLTNAGFSRRSVATIGGALFFYLRGAVLGEFNTAAQLPVPPEVASTAFKEGLDVVLKGARAQLEEDQARRAARARSTTKAKSSR
ncbi:MAG: hypothetical protein JWL70_2737 [Acidimicrobiia bacterium]|nr:hypothetical protein [Acidimicrobiia bacterium]